MVLFANLNDQQAQLALETCRKIEGVGAEKCKYDSESNQLRIGLAGKAKVTPTQIAEALANAGVEFALTESGVEATQQE